jgi:hypothetical protein
MTTVLPITRSLWPGFLTQSRHVGVFLFPATETVIPVFGGFVPDDQQAPTDLLRYVDSNISRLRRRAKTDGSVPVPEAVEQKLRRLLAHCASPSAVFPTVASTERGGAHLYWRAGEQSIEVLLENANEFYVRIITPAGETKFEQEGSGDLPSAEIGAALADLSSRVVRANPEWRSLFHL